MQLFTVLACWGYEAGAKRGRLWSLAASPRDDAASWAAHLRLLPGAPELVVYDSDKAIASAVPQVWPQAHLHLCEHHLYVNARQRLREDNQHGFGNLYRSLLANAAQSHTDWSVFRNAVLAADPPLPRTTAWVQHWDAQLTAQTARRPKMPEHRSTGALDPHLARIRRNLDYRAWTLRNLNRLNALLSLTRLAINLCDQPAAWARTITIEAAAQTTRNTFDEPANILPNGSRMYSLRAHPVPPRG